MNKMFDIVIILFAILSISCTRSQSKEVKIKFHDQVYYDVFVFQDGSETNLTNFNSWENVTGLTISPDSNYFFFRHKPDKGEAYQLCLYNLKTLKKINEITPGFGGSFDWNELNQIIHWWGCGTGCSNINIYDLKLNKLFFSLSSGGFELNPKKDILIQFNMTGTKFWLFDLRINDKGLQGFTDTAHYINTEEKIKFDLWSLKFIDDYSFQIYPPAEAGSSEVLNYNIENLNLIPLKPEDTNEFYERNE
jgi:hypothetical protein